MHYVAYRFRDPVPMMAMCCELWSPAWRSASVIAFIAEASVAKNLMRSVFLETFK